MSTIWEYHIAGMFGGIKFGKLLHQKWLVKKFGKCLWQCCTAYYYNYEMDWWVKKFWWFKFGKRLVTRQIRQTFPPPNFPAIWYTAINSNIVNIFPWYTQHDIQNSIPPSPIIESTCKEKCAFVKMHCLGIEPRSQEWESCMIPLHQQCFWQKNAKLGKHVTELGKLQ